MTTDAATPEPKTDPVAAIFTTQFPGAVYAAGADAAGETQITVDRTQLTAIVRQAHDQPELGFDFLRCITGVDQLEEGIEVIYSLLSLTHRHRVHIKTVLPVEDPTVQSITPFWVGADWHEREIAEMFGVTFLGHPSPKHLLLDDDMTIHPLLKAHPLAAIELKQGEQTF